MSHFRYGQVEIEYLSRQDPKLGAAIAAIGPVRRAVETDLFHALVNSIVDQQISAKAAATVRARIVRALGTVTPQTIIDCPQDTLQALGMSHRKAAAIRSAADRILRGYPDITVLHTLPDADVCAALVRLDGVGQWTAEMLLLHALERPDVLSYGDLGIRRGLSILHGLSDLPRPLFDEYRRLYSPCGSVASLYLWVISAAGGVRPEG